MPPVPSTEVSAGDSRSARKRRAILDAATTLFLRNGYLGTSMDEVAASAGVSKQTVYKHFADKESLFREIVSGTVDEISDPNEGEVLALAHSDDLQADMRAVARAQLERVMHPRVLQLRRLVIGEAERFPELGRIFYERGPRRTVDALIAAFAALAERGRLRLSDPAVAAQQFNWLIMSDPLNRAMFDGKARPPKRAELDRHADAGVGMFLAAYGTDNRSQR